METIIPEWLRKETNDVKGCFTTFSFQAIALSGIVLGAVANYQPKQPFVGLAGILVIFVLITVSRIGNYKYSTANRHYGYQLFMEQVKLHNGQENNIFDEIGWEEALRAWRVIQASLFDEIFYTTLNTKWLIVWPWKYNCVKNTHKKNNKNKSFWFNPSSIVGGEARWYPGRYLHTMHNILHLLAIFSLVPLLFMIVQFQTQVLQNNDPSLQFFISDVYVYKLGYWTLAASFVTLITLLLLGYQMLKINHRRELLEHGILSIHSCSVVWHVVLLAHLRAKRRMITQYNQSEYLRELSREANEIRRCAICIDIWIRDASRSLDSHNDGQEQHAKPLKEVVLCCINLFLKGFKRVFIF